MGWWQYYCGAGGCGGDNDDDFETLNLKNVVFMYLS